MKKSPLSTYYPANCKIKFSLGFNFDNHLIDGLIQINSETSNNRVVSEVYGALPEAPVPSARPTSKIPSISWADFKAQVYKLSTHGIQFNYLMNTPYVLNSTTSREFVEYLEKLQTVGISRLTLGTPEQCGLAKKTFPDFHTTISITYGVHSLDRLQKIEEAGADAVYLDGVLVNRDFALLRLLLKHSTIEPRLYANMSCISACPVVRDHYGLFSNQDKSTEPQNGDYFTGCTLVKINNPVEWLQMPWIRPEDISVYVTEGVSHFKLADRLAPTKFLLDIAKTYLSAESPENLFPIIERDGIKYRMQSNISPFHKDETPIYVRNNRLGTNFIEHFRSGECKSRNVNCKTCITIARYAIQVNPNWSNQIGQSLSSEIIPVKLRTRLNTASSVS